MCEVTIGVLSGKSKKTPTIVTAAKAVKPVGFAMLNLIKLLVVLLPAALNVVACGGPAGSFLVNDGNYQAYDCNQLKEETTRLQIRLVELRQLMAVADKGVGGAVVNLIAYRSEYEQAVSRQQEANVETSRKNCALQGNTKSDRSVY